MHPLSPQRSPAGANDWTCRSRQHPVPVVLVHGTGANQSNNWNAIAPYLANHGYCVYTFTHGITFRYFGGLAPVADSAAELRTFVEQVVLPRTGATQVDLVGHSLGGMMPRYYIKFLGGYTKVRHLVGIAPSNHGSTLDGLSGIGTFLGITALLGRGTPSLADQAQGSAFMKKMDTCPFGLPAADICAGDPVKYTVIQTTQDRIVTPYTNSFLKGATNVVLQQVCPLDDSGHMALAYDRNVGYQVLKALDPRTAGPKVCVKTSALGGG